MMRRFFHSEKTVSELIFSFDDTKIRNDEFIRYRDVIDGNLYPGTDIRMTVHRNKEQRTFTLPYEEVVDFTLRPHTGIRTDGDIPVRYPDDGITECTRPGLDAYLKRNPATYNDRILCMRYLERTEEDGYRCGLTQSDFLDVVRTNLTLDYPLKGSFRETLRQTDSAQRPGTLPSLAASRMMNFIGVSAVWCMDCGSGSFETRYRYYLKCRQTGMSVYSDMLGTTSGYANPPKFASAETAPTCKETDSSAGIPNADTRQGLASGDLLAYLCEEMKGNFRRDRLRPIRRPQGPLPLRRTHSEGHSAGLHTGTRPGRYPAVLFPHSHTVHHRQGVRQIFPTVRGRPQRVPRQYAFQPPEPSPVTGDPRQPALRLQIHTEDAIRPHPSLTASVPTPRSHRPLRQQLFRLKTTGRESASSIPSYRFRSRAYAEAG